MRILLTGGTGFLGRYLGEELLRRNHEVVLLTRQSSIELQPSPYRIINWPLDEKPDLEVARDCDAIINLAGESIAGPRWTKERKEEIRESRIQYTRELVDQVATSTKLKTFISASACGFYGNRKSEVITEESPRGEGFLADVCSAWEAEAKRLGSSRRIVLLRTGAVLDRNNGVLGELEPLYRIGAGGPIGSGDQFTSWIHIKDWVNAVIYALENPKIQGAINLAAPEPVTNRAFSHVYGSLFRVPFQFPAPAAAVKLALGEQSALILDSQNMRPQKLIDNGFHFKFNSLKDALRDLYEFERRQGKIHDLYTSSQWIPSSLENVFEFFSDEKNLEKLTPPLLKFHVDKKSTAKVMKGTLIDYNLRIHGVPVRWQSLIEDWSPPHRFIDLQRFGPYHLWHHTHTFEALAGGVLMKDFVHYRLPLGPIGRAFGLKFVKKDVANIFSFRRQVIREMYE